MADDARRSRASLPDRAPSRSGSPRAVAGYLHQLKRFLTEASECRRSFVREIGVLMEESRRASRGTIAQAAGRTGRDQGQDFRQLRTDLVVLQPPPSCMQCHVAVQRWIEKHVLACQVMVEIGLTGDLGRLAETQELLAEAREHARLLNAEYAHLVADLRARVRSAQARAR